jgi:hypothetical protein
MDTSSYDDMTDDEKRHDELTRAPKSNEDDAAPRITTEKTASGATRIDVADTAKVRPGGPHKNDGAPRNDDEAAEN